MRAFCGLMAMDGEDRLDWSRDAICLGPLRFESDGIPSLYLDPDRVVTMASAAAQEGFVSGLVAITSPSSMAGWPETVPTTEPSSMTSHSSKVGIVMDLKTEGDIKDDAARISVDRARKEDCSGLLGIQQSDAFHKQARKSSTAGTILDIISSSYVALTPLQPSQEPNKGVSDGSTTLSR